MCNLDQVQIDLCTSGIGKVADPILLLQLQAQILANLLVAEVPGTDITVDAIMVRACTSGIAKVSDPTQLMVIIAQNGCELAA